MKFGSVKNKNSKISALPRQAWQKRRLAFLHKSGKCAKIEKNSIFCYNVKICLNLLVLEF